MLRLPLHLHLAFSPWRSHCLLGLFKLYPASTQATKLEATSAAFAPLPIPRRYTVRFYIIAILFVIFDVETIFCSLAVRYRRLAGSASPRSRSSWRFFGGYIWL